MPYTPTYAPPSAMRNFSADSGVDPSRTGAGHPLGLNPFHYDDFQSSPTPTGGPGNYVPGPTEETPDRPEDIYTARGQDPGAPRGQDPSAPAKPGQGQLAQNPDAVGSVLRALIPLLIQQVPATRPQPQPTSPPRPTDTKPGQYDLGPLAPDSNQPQSPDARGIDVSQLMQLLQQHYPGFPYGIAGGNYPRTDGSQRGSSGGVVRG